MVDLIDLLQCRVGFTMTGSYYKRLPDTPDDGSEIFDYKTVDPTEWKYQKLFGNIVNSDGATAAVRINADLGAKVGQYMALQDGKLYKIVSVTKNCQSASKETFRYLKAAPQTEFVVQLVQVENPWEIS